MNRSLIVDGQILQTDAWHRGMGKYMLQVLDELNRNYSSKIEIAMLVNDRLACDKSRFETLHYLYPNIKIVHCDLPVPHERNQDKDAKQFKKQLSRYLDGLFPGTEKFYLITSLFLFDFFAEFPDNCHKLVMFYDLTPMLFWKDLGGYFPKDLYTERFNRLYEADHIFTISETTRQDCLKVFGLNPGLVTNINGGFTKIAENPAKPKGFKVPDKFILFPTGNLPHKNNALTVKAFHQYCLDNNNDCKLLVTSHFNDKAKQHLLSLSEQIIFTGNVPDEELEWLYEKAEAIIFSSKYEGLGMPILDAIANKKPVIVSKIPVFEEMSKHAFYYFDPENSNDLELQIEQALAKHGFKSKLKHYPEVMSKYTWANTTEQLYAHIQESTHNPPKANLAERHHKPRIAVCSIHPGIKNQIGRLSEQLYFSLKDNFQVEYFLDSNGFNFREMERPTFLDSMDCKAFDISKLGLNTYKKYDLVVYLIDKVAVPSRVAQRAVVLPGMLIGGSFTGLDHQAELMKQLLVANSIANYLYNAKGFKEYQNIVSQISFNIQEQHDHPNPVVKVLRSSHSQRKRVSWLSKVYEHDN